MRYYIGGNNQSIEILKGISICMVVLFHAYSRWQELTPWLNKYNFIFFKYGYLGVELFFLISGYLITKSLSCNNELKINFIKKRWYRLFPSMLVSSILIYSTAHILNERPLGQPAVLDILPGLLFIHPFLFDIILSIKLNPLEWSFWSLFVEVIFYLIAYMAHKANKSIVNTMMYVFVFSFFSTRICQLIDLEIIVKIINSSFIYFGWFAMGGLRFLIDNGNNRKDILKYFLLLPLSSYSIVSNDMIGLSMCYMIGIIFYITISYKNFKCEGFINNFFRFMGGISYPLYLIHENAVIAITIKTYKYFDWLPAFLTPIPGIILAIIIAYVIARYVENILRYRNYEKIN
jgi:peptidoglycan/LPS O-acetylase OafA/YrhL